MSKIYRRMRGIHTGTRVSIALIGAIGAGIALSNFNPLVLVAGSAFCVAAIYVATAETRTATGVVTSITLIALVVFPNFGTPSDIKITVGVGALFLALCVRFRALAVQRANRLAWLMALFISYSACVSLARLDYPGAFAELAQLLAIAPLVLLYPLLSPAQLVNTIRTVVLLSVVQATLAIFEVAGMIQPLWGYLGTPLDHKLDNNLVDLPTRGIGTMAHPIPLGLICAFSIVVIYSVNRLFGSRVFDLVCLAALMAGVVCSGSRSAAIATVLGLATAYISKRAGRGSLFGRAGFGIAGLFFFVMFVDVERLFGLDGAKETLSFSHRRNGWDAIPTLLDRPPVQVLTGSDSAQIESMASFDYLQSGFDTIDNQWIGVGLSFGLIGLLLLGAVFFSFANGTWMQRSCGIVLFALSMSFDLISWNIGLALIMCTAYLGSVVSSTFQAEASGRYVSGSPGESSIETSAATAVPR